MVHLIRHSTISELLTAVLLHSYFKKYKNISKKKGCRDGRAKKPQKLGVGMAVCRQDKF